MALQNESIDEELEHFEDVIDETEEEARTISNKQVVDIGLVQNGGHVKSDSGSSESEEDLSATSEDDESDDASEDAEFLFAKNRTDIKKSKLVSDIEGQQSQEPSKKPFLPGGYDPRHREPSYW